MTYGVTWGEGAPDIASLTGTPAITFGTTYVAGSGLTLLDSSAQIKFPSALMSTANASTLTLTDRGTDQTLTNSLGPLRLISADSGFIITTLANNLGSALVTVNVNPTIANQTGGILSNFNAAFGTQTNLTYYAWDGRLTQTSGVLTTCIIAPYHQSANTVALTAGSSTDNKAYAANFMGPFIANANGGFTEVAGINITGPRRSLSNPTVTSASTIVLECPTISGNTQAGIYIKQRTAQQVATNRYGILIDGQNSGTNRYGIQIGGNITGTPTLSVGLDLLAHTVGTTKYSLQTGDPSNLAGIIMQDATDIVLNATTGTKIGTATTQKIGFWNSAPGVQPTAAGTASSWVTGAGLNAVKDLDTFTGSTGATAYTIDDLIKSLKVAGLIKT